MDYNKLFHTAFSQLSPEDDDYAALQSVIERKNNMKQKSVKKTVIIIATAAATLTAGLTVSAAKGWSVTELFTNLFSLRAEETGQESMSHLAYEQIGKPLNIVIDGENYIINVNGIIAGKSTAYVTYDLILDEDYVQISDGDEWYSIVQADVIGKNLNSQSAGTGVLSHEGNTLKCYNHVDFCDIDSLSGETLSLWFNKFVCVNEAGMAEIKIDKTIEIPIDFPIYDKSKIVEMDDEYELGTSSVVLDYVEFTGFTADYHYDDTNVNYDSEEDTWDFISVFADTVVLLKDGTEVKWLSGVTADNCFMMTFAVPIDVNDIAALTIDGMTISLQ